MMKEHNIGGDYEEGWFLGAEFRFLHQSSKSNGWKSENKPIQT